MGKRFEVKIIGWHRVSRAYPIEIIAEVRIGKSTHIVRAAIKEEPYRHPGGRATTRETLADPRSDDGFQFTEEQKSMITAVLSQGLWTQNMFELAEVRKYDKVYGGLRLFPKKKKIAWGYVFIVCFLLFIACWFLWNLLNPRPWRVGRL